MIRTLLLFLTIAILSALPGPSGVALAQSRVTSDTLRQLENTARDRQQACIRLEQAEQDSLAEGGTDKAALYKQAKEHAQQQYAEANARLEEAKAIKREQDRRAKALIDQN